MTMTALLGLIDGVAGNGTAARISSAFDRMEDAEREIGKAKLRYPRRAKALHASFGILCPSTVLLEAGLSLSAEVYRSFCRELLDRVARNLPLEPGTNAEMVVTLCNMSIKAPLAGAWVALYGQLFEEVMGKPPPGGKLDQEAYKGQHDEIQRELSRKLATKRGPS